MNLATRGERERERNMDHNTINSIIISFTLLWDHILPKEERI